MILYAVKRYDSDADKWKLVKTANECYVRIFMTKENAEKYAQKHNYKVVELKES